MRDVRILVCCALLVGLSTAAVADDFRIETRVYSGKTKVSQNTTLFQGGYVYDYLSNPERVAVFDQSHGRFIVLDPMRKVKAEIKTEDVLQFADRYHAVAAKSSNAFTKFAADPEFDVKFGEDGVLSLSSQHLTYRLKTVAASSPETAQQYREFCDWYARFNAMANPGSTPPFARIVVNEELANRGLIPTEVQLTIPAQPGVKSAVNLRSEHHSTPRLLERDDERIAETARHLATFKLIDFDQFEPTSLTKK